MVHLTHTLTERRFFGMAKIFEQATGREIPAAAIPEYLRQHGVHYEFWPVERAPEYLRQKSALSPSEQETLLASFQDHLRRMADEFGYISHDLIVLNPDSTENLEGLLKNFERVHHHTEDEVRFIVDGEGIFTLTRNEETFDVLVTPGDLISVPAGTEHYFTLTAVRNVKAVRLFQTREGWVAIYQDEETPS